MLCDKDIGYICHDCQFKLGICKDPWQELRSSDGIVLWIDINNKIMSAWYDNGMIAIPQDVIDNLSLDNLEVFKFLRKILKDGKLWCSSCHKLFDKEYLKFSHFAGKYCNECADRYKRENSQICMICRQPMYICSC